VTEYKIYYCTTCHSIYTDTKRAATIFNWDVVSQDYTCNLCGEFLAVEGDSDTSKENRVRNRQDTW
jgi:hypothetical protein